MGGTINIKWVEVFITQCYVDHEETKKIGGIQDGKNKGTENTI